MTTHKIESGETLTSIAKKYNTTVDAIAGANSIKNKDLIYAGSTLKIPTQSTTVTNSLSLDGATQSTSSNKNTLSENAAKSIAGWKKSRPVAPKAEYSDDIKQLVASLTGMDFSYDPKSDKAYKLILGENKKNARLAMEDTLGKALSMTGGYSNTYAQGAAQQAYANELSGTTELIPELYSAAYDRFSDERDALSDSIKLLSDLDGAEFDKYATLLKQYLSEGEMLLDDYEWASEEEFDRFLDYAELLQKAAQ